MPPPAPPATFTHELECDGITAAIMSLYVQYGCGLTAPHGWLNFDASPTIRLQRMPVIGAPFRRAPWPLFPPNVRYGDIVAGLPVAERSCAGVYCSHVLEHLSLVATRTALRNTFSYLEDGGMFRMVLPDLQVLAREYLEAGGHGDAGAAHRFQSMLDLGQEDRPRSLKQWLHTIVGNSHHKWMWDYTSLAEALTQAGFHGIRRAAFGDSADPRFAEVEEQSRWDGCLGIECSR